MITESYRLFVPPGRLGELTPPEWSAAEARQYFVWLRDSIDERTKNMLAYLGDTGEGPAEATLERLGQKVSWVLHKPDFSHVVNGSAQLTNRGYALAADIGLLLARLLVERSGGAVKWEILRKPKNAAAYNLPVLVGFGQLHLEPIRGSLVEANAILEGRGAPDAWRKAYALWLTRVEPGSSKAPKRRP